MKKVERDQLVKLAAECALVLAGPAQQVMHIGRGDMRAITAVVRDLERLAGRDA